MKIKYVFSILVIFITTHFSNACFSQAQNLGTDTSPLQGQPVKSYMQQTHKRIALGIYREKLYTYTEHTSLARNQQELNRLFQGNFHLPFFSETTERGSITLGNLFASKERYAVIAYQTTDSTLCTHVLHSTQTGWDTVFTHTAPSFFDEMMPGEGIIDLTDYNDDNIPDLRVIHNYWEIYPGNQGHLWTYKNGTFTYIPGFQEVVSPQYDKKTRKIYSYQSDGCGDMSMNFSVYQIHHNQVKQLSYTYCDCCGCPQEDCTVTTNGKPATVKPSKVHLYVPVYFKEAVKDKMGYCEE